MRPKRRARITARRTCMAENIVLFRAMLRLIIIFRAIFGRMLMVTVQG